jgi:hypothetical protein
MDDFTDDTTLVPPTLQLSPADRLRVFREDDAALAELAQKAHQRAMADGDNANAAGHLDLAIRARRAAMWGYDSPVRFDMVQLEQAKQPDGHERLSATIRAFIDRLPPAQKMLRRRLEEISAEEALEKLGLPKPLPDGGDDPAAGNGGDR